MVTFTPSWYEEHIEEGVRDVVRFLRDNGYNTCCSCHHDMTIQVEASPGIDLQNLHNILYLFFHEQGEENTFTITYTQHVDRGATISCFVTIALNRPRRPYNLPPLQETQEVACASSS
jgi:hypothetical protein